MKHEPDRKELREAPPYQFTLDRREFLEVAGIVICLSASASPAQEAAAPSRLKRNADGTVTVFAGKVEFGQGARTEIAMAVAEELGLPVGKVRVVLADTDVCPNDGITAGSRTTPSTIPAVRKAAGGPKAVADWKVLGKSQGPVHAAAIVTGKHVYPSDVKRPGMLYGSVLRAPAYNARLQSAPEENIDGVTLVRDNNFVACAAKTSFAARQAIAAIGAKAKWEIAPHPSHGEVFDVLKSTAKEPRVNARGDVASAMARAAKKIKVEYRVPFIQHAPMEPRAAVAEWNEGKLTVWTGTQNPFGVKQQLQQAFRLAPEKVRVIVPDSGGGFGGKHTGEVAIEAARIAKDAGKPVHLRWTRAEEFMWAYFRPAGYYEVEAGADASGVLTAWDFGCYNAGTAALESPYNIANTRTRYYACASPMREGSYRGIAATANTFVREGAMEELAYACGVDPLEFRLRNCANPRLRAVLETAADKFGYAKRRGRHKGIGIAGGTEKGSYVAACAEVRNGRLIELHMAFECGAILNPSNLKAQVEGSIIQGLGGALSEAMEFSGGRLLNGSFAKYKMPRMAGLPKIEITLIDRRDLEPAGAGETPIIAVAPAIASAFYHASGAPRRQLPLL
jgi:isoquinoline 1-oxidoreductase